MAKLSLHVITWNVAEKEVLEDKKLSELLQLDAKNKTDIYVVGLQEIASGAVETAKSFVVYDDWTLALMKILSNHEFYLVENVRVQGISLCVFSKIHHLPFIRFIKTDIERTGLGGNWGNKGGVAVSFCIHGTRICFLNTHLAAHHQNTEDRINNFDEIHKEIDFGGDSSIESHDVAFWCGDTNFRINEYSKEEIVNLVEKRDYENLIAQDQLKITQKGHKLMSTYIESKINFPPSYKFDPETDIYDTSEKQRKPAWTDRILYRIHPDYPNLSQYGILLKNIVSIAGLTVSDYIQKSLNVQENSNHSSLIEPDHDSYTSHMEFRMSDHKPVSQKFTINVPKLHSPLVSLKLMDQWKSGSEGKISISYFLGMPKGGSDFLALYEDPVTNSQNYKNWVYVPDADIDPKQETNIQEGVFPIIGDATAKYRIGYYSDKMSCLLALSDVFTVLEKPESSSK